MRMNIKKIDEVTYNITGLVGCDLQSRKNETHGMWDLYNLTDDGYVKQTPSVADYKKFNSFFTTVIKNII
jgi:hypothetical protein